MSLVKYRIKEVAADFGIAPKEISQIVEKFFEKPKSSESFTISWQGAAHHITAGDDGRWQITLPPCSRLLAVFRFQISVFSLFTVPASSFQLWFSCVRASSPSIVRE